VKILYLAKLVPWDPRAWGGDEHSFMLSSYIAKMGHEAIFVNNSLHSNHYAKPQSGWQPCKLPYVTYRGRPFYPKAEDLRKLLEETKPDLVHHFSTMGYHFEKQRNGIPSICSLWSDRMQVAGVKSKWKFVLRGKPFRSWAAHCEQVSAKRADCVTTTSRANAESLKENYDLSSVIAIPRGLDTEEFTPHCKPQKIILVPCRLEHEKGVQGVIQVFDQLSPDYPDWKLQIAGEGPAEKNLKSLARQTDKIQFLGRVPSPGMPSLYSRSSIIVLNSTYEPFGAVVTEAGSCARPVIATCHGGPSEIIENGRTGILIDPDNPRTLRKALIILLQDESKAHKMGKRARDHIVKNYSWVAEAKAYATLYEEIANQ